MKKILKFIGVALGLLLIVFLSIGFFSPALVFKNKVVVNKPVIETFSKFLDQNLMKEWIPGFKGITWVSGFPMTLGCKWMVTIDRDGKEYKLIETLKAFKVNELFAFNLESDALSHDVAIHFSEQGDQTVITVDNQVKGKNIFWNSLFVFRKDEFAKKQGESYELLKKSIEH
jgi:hypothetical protein